MKTILQALKYVGIVIASLIGGIIFLIVISVFYVIVKPDDEEEPKSEITITANDLEVDFSQYFEDPKEENLVYKDSKEEAILTFSFTDTEYPCLNFINDVVWEAENDEYALMYYHSVKSKWSEAAALVKFKVKNENGKKQYAVLRASMVGGGGRFQLGSKTFDTVRGAAPLFDFEAVYSIEKGKRFFWGAAGADVKMLRIEGQSPTEVIEYEFFGKPEYFWYYEDLDSDKPSAEWTIEMEEE